MAVNKIDMLEKGLSPSGEPLKKSSPTSTWDKIGSWIGGLWNDFTGKTNNQMNLDFQRENLDYQKALQKQIFEREDSAYQRTVNDMRAAGLNPVSMQGTNGSGEAFQTDSQNVQKTSDLQAVSEIMNVMNQISNTRNNASLSHAQSNLMNAQAENQRIKNLWESDILASTFEGLDLDNVGKRFSNERQNIAWLNEIDQRNFNNNFGIIDNMPDILKLSLLQSGIGAFNKKDTIFTRDWDSFGKTFNDYQIPDFVSHGDLRGALIENNILNGLLSLLPGLGKVLGK